MDPLRCLILEYLMLLLLMQDKRHLWTDLKDFFKAGHLFQLSVATNLFLFLRWDSVLLH